MKTESECQTMLNKILEVATEVEPTGQYTHGTCKVKARFSKHDGPISPWFGQIREVKLHVSKRVVPTSKPGYMNWFVGVVDFDWAEYSDVCTEVYSDEIGITFMVEEYRMNVMEIL